MMREFVLTKQGKHHSQLMLTKSNLKATFCAAQKSRLWERLGSSELENPETLLDGPHAPATRVSNQVAGENGKSTAYFNVSMSCAVYSHICISYNICCTTCITPPTHKKKKNGLVEGRVWPCFCPFIAVFEVLGVCCCRTDCKILQKRVPVCCNPPNPAKYECEVNKNMLGF